MSHTSAGATLVHASAGTAAAACSTAKVFTFDSFDESTSRAAPNESKRAILVGGTLLNADAVVRRHMMSIELLDAARCGFLLRRTSDLCKS